MATESRETRHAETKVLAALIANFVHFAGLIAGWGRDGHGAPSVSAWCPQMSRSLVSCSLATSTTLLLVVAGTSCAPDPRAPPSSSVNSRHDLPDPLERGFVDPPDSARPLVWWHWMNGNITREGIQLDLEWMHRVGVRGFQVFDASMATPKAVGQRLPYMSPEWRDAFHFATVLADRLGLEETIAASPGWSETGGPWVTPSQGMKKYVWSETIVEGGRPFTGKLAHPPSNTGDFQNLGGDRLLGPSEEEKPSPEYYSDGPVIAFRQPTADQPSATSRPEVTSSAGPIDAAALSDGDLKRSISIPVPTDGSDAWIEFRFSKPQTVRALTAVVGRPGRIATFAGQRGPEVSLAASNDGSAFQRVTTLPEGRNLQHTLAFPAVTARQFRLILKQRQPRPPLEWLDADSVGFKVPAPVTHFEVSELVLHGGARVHRFEEKAAFVTAPDLYSLASPPAPQDAVIAKSDVVDLTTRMRPDGTLDWSPPPGRWVVLRFGCSLLGTINHPASLEATGECPGLC